MREIVKLYFKKNDKVIEENIDVNLVPDYVKMGWTFEKPEIKIEKKEVKKEFKKELNKHV